MNILTEEQVEYLQTLLQKQMCRAGKRLALTYSLVYNKFPPPSDFYLIMIVFVSLLCVVVLDEMYYGSSCSKQRLGRGPRLRCRKEYIGIENNKKKVKFDFGNSKVLHVSCHQTHHGTIQPTLNSSSYPSEGTPPQPPFPSSPSWGSGRSTGR